MNVFLKPFQKKLQLEIAQTIFADNRVHHIGKLNCHNEVTPQDLGLIEVFKNFSLPVTILNQCFEISKNCEESLAKIYTDMDALLSFCNLSKMSMDERIKYIKQMQVHAPKALFIDYELPERNINYPMYYTFLLGEHLNLWKQCVSSKIMKKKVKNTSQLASPSKQATYFKEYLQHGALEAFIYDLPTILENSPKLLKRSHLCGGGLGLFYCEW